MSTTKSIDNTAAIGASSVNVMSGQLSLINPDPVQALYVKGGSALTGVVTTGNDLRVTGNIYTNNVQVPSITVVNTAIATSLVPYSTTTQVTSAIATSVYETVNAVGGVVNAYTVNYASGGIFAIGTTPTAASTLAVTNIPTDTTKSYTFTVMSTQSSRFYINTVQVQDTASAYITNGGIAGFVAPLFNGGTPSLSGTTPCVIAQQFTVISVGGVRKVICSVSCCS
jgi:hypothetical protein